MAGWVAVDRLRVTWWGQTGTASAAPYSARWRLPTLLLQCRPAAGNPSESRAARRLALPTPPSLLPSFIFPPPPCPVSQVIPSHPRGRRLIPRCFTAAHGSPPGRPRLLPVGLHPFTAQHGAASHVLSFQGDGHGPPVAPAQGTGLCLHGTP